MVLLVHQVLQDLQVPLVLRAQKVLLVLLALLVHQVLLLLGLIIMDLLVIQLHNK